MGAGVGILDALRSLEEQSEDEFQAVVVELQKLLSAGSYLSGAMAKFPRVFSKVYLAMVRVGESTGALVSTLERLAVQIEEEETLLRKVKASLTYPAIVVVSAFVMTLIVFYLVMPGFVEIFRELGGELPLITHILILITDTLMSPITMVALLTFAILTGKRLARYLRTDQGMYRGHNLLLAVPLLGETLKLVAAARFSSALSATVGSGLSLPLSLRLSNLASGSPVFQRESKLMIDAISEGESVGSFMRSRPDIYPSLLTQMVEVGEESSRLEPLLRRASRFFSEEVERRLEALTTALEPIFLLVASLGVGLLLLGIFLPLYGFLGELGV